VLAPVQFRDSDLEYPPRTERTIEKAWLADLNLSNVVPNTYFHTFTPLPFPAPSLNQRPLHILFRPSTASTSLAHIVQQHLLLPQIRKPVIADEDGKRGRESGWDPGIANGNADKGTHVRQRSLLHGECGGFRPRSDTWEVGIVGCEQQFCHVEEMGGGDVFVGYVTDLGEKPIVVWITGAEVDRVEAGRAAGLPPVQHIAKFIPSRV